MAECYIIEGLWGQGLLKLLNSDRISNRCPFEARASRTDGNSITLEADRKINIRVCVAALRT
jgi:hypothetical protein